MDDTTKNKALIYKQYKDKVLRYVRKNISYIDEAEDIASDIFIKIFSNLDKYDSKKASLSTWIYLISSRIVIDHYRKNSKFSAVCIDGQSEQKIGIASISAQDEIDAKYLKEDALDMLAKSLKKLDERERDLLVLRYYKKETLKTIAEMMNISYSSCKILHKSALNNLRFYLKKYGISY